MAIDKNSHGRGHDQDFIVVNDGSPRIGLDGENLTPAPATSSNTPAKSPSTDRGGRSSRPQSQRRSDGGFNDTLDPLRALPEARPIPWYTGKELPTEKATESTRVQTRGACLLASRGKVNDPPCNHCKSGVGRFSVCVSLDDWFHGACATCQLATRGNLCSLRTNKDDAVNSESEQREPPSAEMSANTRAPKRKRVESSSTPAFRHRKITTSQSQSEPQPHIPATVPRASINIPSTQPHDAPYADDEYKSQFGVKRKRESLQETSVYRPYVSPYAPLDPPNRLSSSLPNTPNIHPTPNIIIPAKIARNQAAYNNYIRERANPHNGTTRQPIPQPPTGPGFKAVNGNGYKTSLRIIETSQNIIQNSERDRDATESMSPSAQLLDRPLQSPSPEPPVNNSAISHNEPTRMTTRNSRKKAATNGITTQPNSSRALDPPETPFIDTLPRRKQKQIYSVIGSLESAIRSNQQQIENLQKQLDNLRATLGIDVEGDKDTSMAG